MASKGIFESKYGNKERGAIWQNIAKMLNNCEEFALTAQSLRYHFTTLMKRYRPKTRREVKGTGLGGKELSENEQLLENLIERFEESGRRTKTDTQKTLPYLENEKKKAQEMRKKAMEKIWRDESDTGNKNKVKCIVQKKPEQDCEFISEDLQKENNEREARERQHNQLIIQNQQMQAQQSQTTQVFQQQQPQILVLLLQRQ